MIGEDKLIRFSGCASGEACTVVLRGASTHVLDEAERSLHDALCVLSRTVRETRTIPGGGCCETRMARAIDAEVPNTPGKKALAMGASRGRCALCRRSSPITGASTLASWSRGYEPPTRAGKTRRAWTWSRVMWRT